MGAAGPLFLIGTRHDDRAAATTGRDRGAILAGRDDPATGRAGRHRGPPRRLPVTRLHAAIVVVCALGLLFDVVEAALSNALSAVFSAPPHRGRAAAACRSCSPRCSRAARSARRCSGWLADRHGRRLALGGALLVLAVTSLLAAASTDVAWLTIYRVLLRLRARRLSAADGRLSVRRPAAGTARLLILICGAIGFLGAPAVIFLMRWLTPLAPLGFEAWRWALMIGAIGSAIIGMLFRCAAGIAALARRGRAARRGRRGLPAVRAVGRA